jgi:hypothetical protein
MTLKFFLLLIIFGPVLARTTFGQDTAKAKNAITERFAYPFGTLLKMKVEILDGESLNDKIHESDFLFKIKSVDSISLRETVIMEFRDETGKFPDDEFKLYKYLYGKETGKLSSRASQKMKKEYVGNEYNIVAYETGEFTGIPNGYFKYQPVMQGTAFHFKNYLVVIAVLPNAN